MDVDVSETYRERLDIFKRAFKIIFIAQKIIIRLLLLHTWTRISFDVASGAGWLACILTHMFLRTAIY